MTTCNVVFWFALWYVTYRCIHYLTTASKQEIEKARQKGFRDGYRQGVEDCRRRYGE